MPAAGILEQIFLFISSSVFNHSSTNVWQTKDRVSHRRWPITYCFLLLITLLENDKYSSSPSTVVVLFTLCLFQAILDVVVNLQFSLIEKLWQTFWRYSPPESVEDATVTENRWAPGESGESGPVWILVLSHSWWSGSSLRLVCLFLSSVSEIEARLPRAQLLVLCRNEAVLKWMSTCDHLMYQALVEILIPDVLRPIPSKKHH